MKVFAQIRKVDEAKRLVYGRAAEEVVDRSGEIMDYLSTKPHFQKWSADVQADSDGKSMGNVRAMHGRVAVGKLTDITFDDEGKAIDVCAKVVDDGEWKKVLEGVYTGFSIGGSYVGDARVEKINGQDVKRYTAKPNELSLVDRPCIPTATFFEVQKADGTLAKVDFQKPAEEDGIDVKGDPADVLALGKLMNDAGLTAGQTVERLTKALAEDATATAAAAADAAAKAAVVAPVFSTADVAKKFPITDAAAVRCSFVALHKIDAAQRPADVSAALAKAWADQVKEPLPGTDEQITALQKVVGLELRKGLYSARAMIEAMCCLKGVMESEAYEAYREADGSPVAGMIKSVVSLCGQIVKAIVDEDLKESPNDAAMVALAEPLGALAKLDPDALASLVKALPASAAAVRAALGVPVVDAASQVTDIQKLLDERLAPLTKQLDETKAELARISAEPARARVTLRAVSKQADAVAEHHKPDAPVTKIVDSKGVENPTATLIKSLHQQGGQPITLRLAK